MIAFSETGIKKQIKVNGIIVHSYKPKRSKNNITSVPNRGALVIGAGVRLANYFNCPIFLMAGKTMPWDDRTEGKIYNDYIVANYDFKNIILGKNSSVRTTEGEVEEMHTIISRCENRLPRNSVLKDLIKNIIVVGSAPHIPRIYGHWKKYRNLLAGKTDIKFVRVKIPIRFYVWELAMFLVEGILPRRLRERLLNLAGRHG